MLIKGIISFPTVFQPRAAVPGSAPRYSVQVLLRPDDPQVQQIQHEIEQAKANTWPSGAPAGLRIPLQSYDEKTAGKNYHDPRFSGWYVLSCNAKETDKPAVVDETTQPIIDPSQVFSGAVAHIHFGLGGYQIGNPGVGAFLNGLMITTEEPPMGRLDGKPSVDQMFAGASDFTRSVNSAHMTPPAAPALVTPAAPTAPEVPAPTAPVAPAPAPATPVHQMTAQAQFDYNAYRQAGWSDEQLIQNGLMVPPAATPSFG